tara:strand:- start:99 stop:881 length:783 start_codon:yes stop_codon:yes gene_type:complete
MKAWIIGDSFGVPNITSKWYDKANSEFYQGLLPGNDIVKGNEWTKQVAESLGYEYSIATNFSSRGCSNESILHKIDWLLDNMFNSEDILIIIPTTSNRFMYKDLKHIKQFKFDNIEEIHMPTAGGVNTHIPVIDEYNTLHRDHNYEEYKMISTFDKLLSHLKLHKIKYLFCPGMWTCKQDQDSNFLEGYTPTNIDLTFPAYDIGLEADKDYAENLLKRKINADEKWIYDHFAVADLYTNHMTHIGNNTYAEAVIEWFNDK